MIHRFLSQKTFKSPAPKARGTLNVFFEKPNVSLMKKQGFLGMDMHFHTECSPDSIAGPQATLKFAKKIGIGFAVTDHNAIGGSLSMVKNRFNVPVIPGIELTGKEGTHMLYFFYSARELERAFNKEIKPYLKNPFVADKPVVDLLHSLSKYHCVVSAPHPYSPGVVGIKKLNPPEKLIRQIDAVEAINGYNLRSLNMKGISWMKRTNRGATGGSDGHMVEELGTILAFAHASTAEEFLDELQKRRTTVMGVEDSTLRKAVITLIKEQEMVSKSHEFHQARKLLHSQLSTSSAYYEKKFARFKSRLHHMFSSHHNHAGHLGVQSKDQSKDQSKGQSKEHMLGGSWTRSNQLK